MTVFDAGTIDSVSINEERGTVTLGVVVPEPLASSRRAISALQQKLNGYVQFIQSGALVRQFPGSEHLAPVIEIAQVGEITDATLSIVGEIASQLRPLGISVTILDLDQM